MAIHGDSHKPELTANSWQTSSESALKKRVARLSYRGNIQSTTPVSDGRRELGIGNIQLGFSRRPPIMIPRNQGNRLLTYVVALLFIPTFVGCGAKDGIDRVLVSGQVTFNGSPLAKGQIRFVPIEDSTGPITVESITDGFYTSKDVGGVPVGVHRVEIRGYDPEVYAKAPKGPGSPPIPQLLPKKYNHQSELKATLESGKSEETLDFNLAS
jgi:hypothetical protein